MKAIIGPSAAPHNSVRDKVWVKGWSRLREAFCGVFVQVDALATALDFVLALVADQSRKNCWPLGELAGHAGVYLLNDPSMVVVKGCF
ncbi:MAG: hypothetical protein LBG11_00705 [Bifidobacteriaceae bacterium]|nr:hypothetical protein [Bifidobacteriaceae bacterium]